MQRQQHLRALERHGAEFADALDAASWDASVPACPGMTARDLATHQGKVHRWATAHVRDRLPKRADIDAPTVPTADDELGPWFRDGLAQLVRVLADAPADLECWHFAPHLALTPLEFWTRRQAHETSMHRVDAQQTAGLPVTPFDPELAVDGVDELLIGFLAQPRRRARRDLTATLLLRATDTGDSWLVRSTPDTYDVARGADGRDPQRPDGSGNPDGGAGAELTVDATASDLHLALWGRGDVVMVDGDPAVWRRWRDSTAI